MAAIASRSFSKRGRDGRDKPAPNVRGRGGREGLVPRIVNERQEIDSRNGASPLGDALERLTQVDTGNHRVVTCYLKLEPRDRSRGKYLIKLKNRVKAAVQGLPRLGLERAVAEAVQRDLNRIQQFLRASGNLPST